MNDLLSLYLAVESTPHEKAFELFKANDVLAYLELKNDKYNGNYYDKNQCLKILVRLGSVNESRVLICELFIHNHRGNIKYFRISKDEKKESEKDVFVLLEEELFVKLLPLLLLRKYSVTDSKAIIADIIKYYKQKLLASCNFLEGDCK